MRKLISILFTIFLAMGVNSCAQNPEKAKEELPNIVYIMADDLGIGDLGVYGQEIISTPYIDSLAAAGMTFHNFYAGSTVCAPSRATLLTGQHTGTTKVRGNGEFPLAADKRILPELLKEKGYTNAMFGKWGMGLAGSTGSPEKRSWDEFLGHLHHVDAHFQQPDSLDAIEDGELVRVALSDSTYANDLFTQAALDFIEEQPVENPFFLYLSYTIPHAELNVPEKFLESHLDEHNNSKYPENPWPEGRHYGAQEFPKAAYAALVESVDTYVGKLVAALKQKGIEDNTMVIFTSDNGTHTEGGRTMEDVDFFRSSGDYRGVKRDLYSGGIRTPFIVKWPGQVNRGTQSNHLAAFWDVYPTLADIIGVPLGEEPIDGISILPTLKGKEQEEQHPYLYWEFHEFGGKQALVEKDWKIVRLGVNENPNAPVELYNLAEDPGEQQNLTEKLPEKAEELRLLMDSVRKQNKDFNFGNN